MNVGASLYPSSISCFDLETVDETGSYVVAVPESEREPLLVVGVTPAGRGNTNVHIGSTTVHASTRGRWFIASLEPGALGPTNDVPFAVGFSDG